MVFANRLNGTIIAKGEEFLLAENERGYQFLLMNCNMINPYYATEDASSKAD